MPTILTNTPLSALQALVLDTETTGLDVKQARILEIGIAGHGLPTEWARLLNPGVPIPAKSTAIHGIDDAMVASARSFGEVWPEARSILDGHVLIGHSFGFDLAILKRECERARLPWQEPLWLDTRFLAILIDANLPDFTIGALCSWLNVPVTANHRALADAQATSAVFRAMAPRLRERGIHTFGEALAACRRVQSMSEELARAGWAQPPELFQLAKARQDAESAQAGGFDVYPFQHRVETLMSAPPVFIAPDETMRTALEELASRQISSMFVGSPGDPAGRVAIITERDVLRALAKTGSQALDQPVGPIASRPLVTIRSGAYAYRAIGTMARLGIRHLAVVGDDEAHVIGALSQRDLLRLRAQSSLLLGDEIDAAASAAGLGLSWAKLPAMAQALLREGIGAPDIAGIIARELGALTRRAAILAEQAMIEAGKGAAPEAYGVLVLGSAGRGESLLAMDQDNAIVFAEGAPDGPEDRWFAELGARFARILNEVGVPLCKGGVMASEPAFRGSVATWVERMEHWLGRSNPDDLLNVDIVFDARTVHGDPTLFHGLMEKFTAAASGNAAFLKLMIASHPDISPPVSFFGAIKGDEEGRLDLKRYLISRVVAAARVLAIRHRQQKRATIDRLAAVKSLGLGPLASLDDLAQAYARAQGLVLKAQLAGIAKGRPPDNRVVLSELTPLERARLKDDLSSIANLGDVVRSAVF
ncbi:MAG: CBS domain-containing protein [Methylocystis sp.]|nr:CBS domain-containing protein [Methylocystis sp.]MCA3585287.1 CBS domain-containing protein [Methylocystis sp.]MCA3591614.1 CBS domain-containing protein [Methylocystis sp.]